MHAKLKVCTPLSQPISGLRFSNTHVHWPGGQCAVLIWPMKQQGVGCYRWTLEYHPASIQAQRSYSLTARNALNSPRPIICFTYMYVSLNSFPSKIVWPTCKYAFAHMIQFSTCSLIGDFGLGASLASPGSNEGTICISHRRIELIFNFLQV